MLGFYYKTRRYVALTFDTAIYTIDGALFSSLKRSLFLLRTTTHLPSSNPHLATSNPHRSSSLERSVLQQLLEISLEPSSRLRSRSQRISIPTVGIVARSARVASPITLPARLDPNQRINKRVSRVGSRQAAEPSPLDIAPVAPRLLLRRLHAAAALVDDEVRVPAVAREQRRDRVDVQLLVVVLVALRVGRRGRDIVAVVVGDVGHEAAQRLGLAGFGPDLREQFGCWREVGVPAEPAGVAGVDVRGHVGEVEGFDGVFDARDVGGLGFLAFGDVQVGDEVAETVRF
jgi:hypothetical protein